MISQDRLQKALTYLAETDEKCAVSGVNVERQKYMQELIIDRYRITKNKEGTVGYIEALARQDVEYKLATEAMFMSLTDYKKMSAKRKTEELIVDVFRTEAANRRIGVIT